MQLNRTVQKPADETKAGGAEGCAMRLSQPCHNRG